MRRLFHDGSGRPSGALIETALLHRLRQWAAAISGEVPGTPRIVLLVGGPGNGKTEAVEEAIRALEAALGVDGRMQAQLGPAFSPTDGSVVPRRVTVDLGALLGRAEGLTLTLVQDASVSDPSQPGRSAAVLLVEDLEKMQSAGSRHLYLACVNRGVLDDASSVAADEGMTSARRLLDTVARSVSMSPTAPSCWPLEQYPEVAIWPMDVESLLVVGTSSKLQRTPVEQVLDLATEAQRWPAPGECEAGEHCPFCRSRALLSAEPHRSSLVKVLRWYELATGKRWSFRDLFSLVSLLLAGATEQGEGAAGGPCHWAAKLGSAGSPGSKQRDPTRLASPFLLVASQYQHVLFSSWPHLGRAGIRAELRELKLDGHETLLGLHYFLSGTRRVSVPGTLRMQLATLCDALDPALADPDLEVEVSGRSTIRLRDIDARFSHSVREGLQFIRRYQCLSSLESMLLGRLADADDAISAPDIRRRKPAVAARLQLLLRDFANRIVRRSLGARTGVVRDCRTLRDFESVVKGDEQLMYQAVKQVEGLLNERDRFIVTLNTTFGEPLPPMTRRVVLETERQKVRQLKVPDAGRPVSDLRFLSVGPQAGAQHVPLTYDLFRAVRELQGGMLAASLPRTVIAALDTARARLAGRIVRDEDQLDGAEIRIGLREDVIVREMKGFLVRREGGQ